MTTLRLRLPESLHKRLAELARREGISINQLVTTAVAEKMSALDTEELLEERAQKGSRKGFLAALAKVPAVEPDAGDELPAKLRQSSERVAYEALPPRPDDLSGEDEPLAWDAEGWDDFRETR